MKKKTWISLLIAFLILSLSACNRVSFQSEKGTISKEDLKTVEYKYSNQNAEGFYASLDFNINSGKVLWSIYNNSNHTLKYEGYVIVRDGKKIRALTYPVKTEPEDFNTEGEQSTVETFGYLQFDPEGSVGEHTLSIKPISAEGDYTVKWFKQLPRK